MSVSTYILPVMLVALIVVCVAKKVKVYDCFLLGAKDGLNLVVDIFPYVATIFICIETFKASGLAFLVGLQSRWRIWESRAKLPNSFCSCLCRATERLRFCKTSSQSTARIRI